MFLSVTFFHEGPRVFRNIPTVADADLSQKKKQQKNQTHNKWLQKPEPRRLIDVLFKGVLPMLRLN